MHGKGRMVSSNGEGKEGEWVRGKRVAGEVEQRVEREAMAIEGN